MQAGRLVTSHLRLIIKIAQRRRGRTVPLDELISDGHVGLKQAVKSASIPSRLPLSFFHSGSPLTAPRDPTGEPAAPALSQPSAGAHFCHVSPTR
jgi:hypothetical protein